MAIRLIEEAPRDNGAEVRLAKWGFWWGLQKMFKQVLTGC